MGEILAEYPSKSSPGKHYNIVEGKDGVIYCTCWQWKKHKTCMHLNDYHSGNIYVNGLLKKKKRADKPQDFLQEAIANAVTCLKGA